MIAFRRVKGLLGHWPSAFGLWTSALELWTSALELWTSALGLWTSALGLWLGSMSLPRSGYASKPRVASTLGSAQAKVQPGTGCAQRSALYFNNNMNSDLGFVILGRNPFRVGLFRTNDPGLKQPWALGRNRFAVKTKAKVQSSKYKAQASLCTVSFPLVSFFNKQTSLTLQISTNRKWHAC